MIRLRHITEYIQTFEGYNSVVFMVTLSTVKFLSHAHTHTHTHRWLRLTLARDGKFQPYKAGVTEVVSHLIVIFLSDHNSGL